VINTEINVIDPTCTGHFPVARSQRECR